MIRPFLKAYNKRATPPPNPPVEWMDIGCIKIDGVALDALDDAVLASGVFANKEAKVLLLPLGSLIESAASVYFDFWGRKYAKRHAREAAAKESATPLM